MISIFDYCDNIIGFNPFTLIGRKKILSDFSADIFKLKQEEPNMELDYYIDGLIDEKIIIDYLDLTAKEGINILLTTEQSLIESKNVLIKHLFDKAINNKTHSFETDSVIVFRAKNINNVNIENLEELWRLQWNGSNWCGDGLVITDKMLCMYAENNVDSDGFTYFVEEVFS